MPSLILTVFIVVSIILAIGCFFLVAKYKSILEQVKDLNEELSQRRVEVARAETHLLRVKELEEDIQRKEQIVNALQQEKLELTSRISTLVTSLEEQQRSNQEKLDLLNGNKEKLLESFKALSSDVLQLNNEAFLKLAQTNFDKFHQVSKGELDQRKNSINDLVKPLKEQLGKYETHISLVEKERVQAYESLHQQMKTLSQTQQVLRKETGNLVKALRTPNVRGRWGEIQLKRVVELAGMTEYCDFTQQETFSGDEGQKLRPDMIIRLPNQKNIIVDSKVPLHAYLEALETEDEEQKKALLLAHAKLVTKHINDLSSKNYWKTFEHTPEFVVLFMPGENFFSAALEQDPSLIELGVDKSVIVATPTTLIALLRAVAYGWRNEQLAENASKIRDLGSELYERICTLSSHFADVGKGLDRALDSYNKVVGSLESRVLVSARRFKELGVSKKEEIGALEPLDIKSREVQILDEVGS